METPEVPNVEFDARVTVDLNEGSRPNEEGTSKDQQELSEEGLEELEESYELYSEECKAALNQVLLSIETLSKAIDRVGKRNPFDRIESRIKTFKSTRGKCRKRGYDFTIETIRENIRDVAGVRIITKYIDEVMKVKELISQIPGINITCVKDYVTVPKPNGYSSLHLACQVGVYDPYNGSRLIPVEIQIRSKGMNLWATLEHDLKYKNLNPVPQVEEKFRRIAKIIRDFEEEAMALRDYDMTAEENTVAVRSAEVRAKISELSVKTN